MYFEVQWTGACVDELQHYHDRRLNRDNRRWQGINRCVLFIKAISRRRIEMQNRLSSEHRKSTAGKEKTLLQTEKMYPEPHRSPHAAKLEQSIVASSCIARA